MVDLDAAFQQAVSTLLSTETFGTSATWEKQATTADPTTGVVTGATTYNVTMASPQHLARGLVDGELFTESDLITYLKADGLSFIPAEGDRVTVGSDEYSVVSVRPLRARDKIVAYEVRLRGSQ